MYSSSTIKICCFSILPPLLFTYSFQNHDTTFPNKCQFTSLRFWLDFCRIPLPVPAIYRPAPNAVLPDISCLYFKRKFPVTSDALSEVLRCRQLRFPRCHRNMLCCTSDAVNRVNCNCRCGQTAFHACCGLDFLWRNQYNKTSPKRMNKPIPADSLTGGET